MQKDIRGYVKVIKNAQLLMNKFDATPAGLAWRMDLDLFSVESNRADVPLDYSTENLHQG